MNYILIISLTLSHTLIHTTSNQELFLRGNKAYRAGAYQDALQYYEQISQKGDAVWHNMGNCCSQLQRPADACVYWQRAQTHAAYEDYCALETQIASVDTDSVDEQQAWLFWIRAHTASFSLLLIQLITMLVWFALFVAIGRRMHWSVLAILGLLSVFLIWLSVDTQRQWCRVYAVTTEQIPVYVGPNLTYHQQGTVKHPCVVTVTDEREGWYKITHKELAGWVQADKLVKV